MIRDVTQEDFDFLIEGLEKNRKIEGRDPKNIPATQEDIDDFNKGIKNKTIRIAEENGKPIAFLHYKTDFKVLYIKEKFFWVDLIYVHEDHRKKGLGKKLYEDIAQVAKEKGYEKIIIDIFDENKNSLGFHEKLGFKPIYSIFEKVL